MYFIHQELQVVDLGIEEVTIQLLSEIPQEDLIHHKREISITLN